MEGSQSREGSYVPGPHSGTTVEASFRHGLGATVEGAFIAVGGSLEIQAVTESSISLPGGITHKMKDQALLKLNLFGFEFGAGWERSVDVDPRVYFDGPMNQEAHARLSAQPWIPHWGGRFTGNIPRKIKVKGGGTIWIGGSLGVAIEVLKPRVER